MTPLSWNGADLRDSLVEDTYDSPAPRAPDDVAAADEASDEALFERTLRESKAEYNRGQLNKLSKAPLQTNPHDTMILSLNNEFAPLLMPEADTLVYIGPPPKAVDQSSADYQRIERRFNTLHRVQSQTLKALGSSVFEKLLGPKSERTRRRLGKDGLLGGADTSGIKFYVDLRPPEDGDEAVELITDLTCTQGILNWYKAQAKYSIAPTMICGREDFLSPLAQFRDAQLRRINNLEERLPVPEPEYSALRHRSAIERVLQAINHHDPRLDSAPKMWTYFQVARHLDVAKHERINGWITKWIYTHPNSNFIQNNPEVVYRIGMGIKSEIMIRDAYSMLAGEKALLDTSDPTLRLHLKTSIHGRHLEILDDDERNRIDHAASSLRARIKLKFDFLVDEQMDWLKLSSEYSRLCEFVPRDDNERNAFNHAERTIKDYVRGRLLWVMGRNNLTDPPHLEQSLVSCQVFRPGLPGLFCSEYETLKAEQRLLTRTMWIALQSEKIDDGHCNVWTPSKSSTGVLYLMESLDPHGSSCPIGHSLMERENDEPGTGIRKIPQVQLFESLRALRTTAARAKHRIAESDEEEDRQDGGHEIFPGPSMRARSYSGRGKRKCVTSSLSSIFYTESHPSGSELPLRPHKPDTPNPGVIPHSAGKDDSTISGADSSFSKVAVKYDSQAQSQHPDSQASTVSSSYNYNGVNKFSPIGAVTFDTQARVVAEALGSYSWDSFEGDTYVIARPYGATATDLSADAVEKTWFALPDPFKWSETVASNFNGGRQYWRATTCQLFCKYPDNRISLVHETLAANPTIVEAAARFPDVTELNCYVDAYNAYARHLAETLRLPYWTALNGDMFLRNPPFTEDANADIWEHASIVFDLQAQAGNLASNLLSDPTCEYWRSPAGHLFRRRAGRIEVFSDEKEESAPASAASILAAPLKIATSKWMKSFSPPARYVGTIMTDTFNAQSPSQKGENFRYKYPPQAKASSSSMPTFEAVFVEPYIDIYMMLDQFSRVLSRYCEDILHPAHLLHSADAVPVDLMDTLMCLTEDEWKYLPLWAGGNDDGTGGVFDEVDVPNLEAGGFKGGKRGLRIDSSANSEDSDGFTDVGSEAVSTVGRASKMATDGTETVMSFDSQSSVGGPLKMDSLWEEVRNLKGVEDRPVSVAHHEADEDQITVMDAASDVQHQMFGDVDSEGDGRLGDDDDEDDDEDDDDDDEDEDDMDIIRDEDLA